MFTLPITFFGGAGIVGPSLDGLKHWVEADSGVTVNNTDDNHVVLWADKSGNGNDWSEDTGFVSLIDGELNGHPVISSEGGTGGGAPYLTMPSLFATGNPAIPAEVYVVIRNSTGSDIGFSWLGSSTETNSSHYPNGGVVYDNFGSTVRSDFNDGNGGADQRAFHIYNISNGANASPFIMRSKGVQQYSGGPFDSSWISTWRLFASNPAAPSGYGLHGQIAALLIYDHAHDSDERLQTYTYLSTKYGVT